MLNNIEITTLSASGTALFAGTVYGGVWRRPLSEMISGTADKNSKTPLMFSLEQNYPNPFNPATTISYSLAERANVTINIYNQLGQKVTELFSGEKPAGAHSIQWNAGSIASGIYFYELRTEKFSQVRKLILMK